MTALKEFVIGEEDSEDSSLLWTLVALSSVHGVGDRKT